MENKMPFGKREYDLSTDDQEDEQGRSGETIKEIMIEGYKVVFDKKIAVTPAEVVSIIQLKA